MCGIQVQITCAGAPKDVNEELARIWPYLTEANGRRGPDAHDEVLAELPLASLKIGAHVLHLRGPQTQPQPLVAQGTGDILCWNGEIFGGLKVGSGNDGVLLLEEIQRQKKRDPENYILQAFSTIEGPYAFVYLDRSRQKIWFARDYLGRRSLLTRAVGHHALLISSVAAATAECGADGSQLSGWTELPAQKIYCLDLAELSRTEAMAFPGTLVTEHKWHYATDTPEGEGMANPLVLPFGRVVQEPSSNAVLRGHDQVDDERQDLTSLLDTAEWQTSVDCFEQELTAAIRARVESIPGNGSGVRVGLLFSGGVDCITIAALLTRILPASEPIELFNVAFENPRQAKLQRSGETPKATYDVPDRKTGRQGWRELCQVDPEREWRFVEVDVPYSQVLEHRGHIRQLLVPSDTVMDMSIGMAIWFASRGGHGTLVGLDGQRSVYGGRALVLLLGMGADEQLGGYSRHRVAWDRGQWQALGREIALDVERIATRNLGRDDRVVSDNGREARFPFLAANVVRLLSAMPLDRKMDMRYPRGMGEKLLLRLLARRLGLVNASTLAKRAIQFGARTAKMESAQSRGQDSL